MSTKPSQPGLHSFIKFWQPSCSFVTEISHSFFLMPYLVYNRRKINYLTLFKLSFFFFCSKTSLQVISKFRCHSHTNMSATFYPRFFPRAIGQAIIVPVTLSVSQHSALFSILEILKFKKGLNRKDSWMI